LRELRGGLRGFYVFIACIALGVMAIAGVGSVAASLSEGLAREGRTLLGGDAAFSLIQRESQARRTGFSAFARKSLGGGDPARHGAQQDGPAGAGRAQGGRQQLSVARRSDAGTEHAGGRFAYQQDGTFGAAADATLLARLDLKIGDRVSVGSASFQIRSVVAAEPDKLAGGVGFGPRFLVSEAGLRATELLQPGSLVRWIYRAKLPDNAADDRAAQTLASDARTALPSAGGNPHPQQCLAAAGTHHQPFHPVSHTGRSRRVAGWRPWVANAVKAIIDRPP